MIDLTLEQELDYRIWKDSISKMSRVQILKTLKDAERLNYVKSNIIQGFINFKKLCHSEFQLTLEQQLFYGIKIKNYEEMNKKALGETLLDTMKMLCDKDNTLKNLMRNSILE